MREGKLESLFFFLKDFPYLLMRHTEREGETQAEGEAGSLQRDQCGTQSLIPGSCLEPTVDAQPLSHPGVPKNYFLT